MTMTLLNMTRWAYENDRFTGQLANVIMYQCGHRCRKMRGLYNLITSGNEVRLDSNKLMTIRINGNLQPISNLEKHA